MGCCGPRQASKPGQQQTSSSLVSFLKQRTSPNQEQDTLSHPSFVQYFENSNSSHHQQTSNSSKTRPIHRLRSMTNSFEHKQMSHQELPLLLSFLGGSLTSTVAQVCTFPMDNIKTRMQMGGTQGIQKYSSTYDCIVSTYTKQGLSGFYKGIQAASIRQFIYSGIRIAIYDKLKAMIGYEGGSTSKMNLFFLAAVSGGISSLLTNPLDVAKIRLINDPQRKVYTSYINVFKLTYKNDGFVKGFYKGSSPNVYRSILVNASELGTYDSFKSVLIENFGFSESSIACRFWSSVLAGFVGAVVTSPLDVVKTRYMNSSKAGTNAYSSPLNCLTTIAKDEGILALYNGFLPLWMRLGPWCVIMFMSWDFYKDVVGKIYFRK